MGESQARGRAEGLTWVAKESLVQNPVVGGRWRWCSSSP
jgi:hypothetical protein